MARHTTFTFRVNEKEREMVEALAKHMRRTMSDTVRILVIDAAEALVAKQAGRVGESTANASNYAVAIDAQTGDVEEIK